MKSKKSTGLDDISPYLLKKCTPYIIKPFIELVNASIREGIFSSKLKNSVVKPIYKNRTKEGANNYHPIALVPALSKVLEKVVANQLIAFIEKHNILNKSEFGFSKINLRMMQLLHSVKTQQKASMKKQNTIAYYQTYQKHPTVFNITFLRINYTNMESV
jgi:hypothetical protein